MVALAAEDVDAALVVLEDELELVAAVVFSAAVAFSKADIVCDDSCVDPYLVDDVEEAPAEEIAAVAGLAAESAETTCVAAVSTARRELKKEFNSGELLLAWTLLNDCCSAFNCEFMVFRSALFMVILVSRD